VPHSPASHADAATRLTNQEKIMNIMSRVRRLVLAGLMASGPFAAAASYVSMGAHPALPVGSELSLINAQTGKCLTIAGGVSTESNVEAVQFECDADPSRRWTLRLKL
jgi:cytolethal distending toxin subunit A